MKTLKRKRNNERGDIFPFVLLMMPVVLLSFGLAIDVSKGHFVKQELNNAAQTAAVSAIQDIDSSGKIVSSKAEKTLIEYYEKNRKALTEAITCAKTSDVKSGEKLKGKGCPWILSKVSYSKDKKTIHVTIREYSSVDWSGQVVPGKRFPITIKTSARVVQN